MKRVLDASNGKTLVKVDKQYYRPLDVNYLCGDSSKAKKALKIGIANFHLKI